MTGVIASLMLAFQQTLPPLTAAENLEGLPEWLAGRWRCSDVEQRGWRLAGFDDSTWVRPTLCPLFETGTIEGPDGQTRAEEQGYRYAFQHFWHPKNRTIGAPIFFRRNFTAPELYADSSTYLSMDDTYELYVNGQKVTNGREDLVTTMREYPVGRLIHRGQNVVAIRAINAGASGGVRSRTDLFMNLATKQDRPIAWKCSRSADSGWSLPGYDATRWVKPVILADPLYKPEIDTAGIWIDATSQLQEAVYFRQEVYLDGIPTSGDIQIAADNGWELWVNGKMLGMFRDNDLPSTPSKVPISDALHRGWNAIGVRAINYGGPAVLYCLPHIRLAL